MLSFLFPSWCEPGKGPLKQMLWFEITPSLDAIPMDFAKAMRFAKHISHLGLPRFKRLRYGQLFFRFLIRCQGPAGQVRLYFSVPDIRWMGFRTGFQTQISGVYLLPVEAPVFTAGSGKNVIAAEGRPVYKGALSVAGFYPEGKDPVNEMIAAMGAGELKAGEEVWLELCFAPSSKQELKRRVRKAEAWMTSPANEPLTLQAIWREMQTNQKERRRPRELTPHQQNVMSSLRGKQNEEEIGLWVSFRVLIRSPFSKARLQTMNDMLQAMRKGNGILLRPVRKSQAVLAPGIPSKKLLFTSEELGYWLRIPAYGDPAAMHMHKLHAKIIPAPEGLNTGLYIGKSNVPGVEKEIRMPLNQILKHAFLAGTTGSGKTSTLLSIMTHMVEDLERSPDTAPGFTFLDPHGGAIETLLSIIPKSLYPKLHLVPLGSTERPRGFNLFQAAHADVRESLTGEFVTTLQQLFPGSRPRAEHYLRNAVLSLLSVPPQTVLGIVDILFNDTYRRKLLPHLDTHLRHFWTDEFAEIKNVGEHLGPILNKLGALTTYPTSRRMLGQLHSSINTRQVMDSGHIVLIDGSGCVPDLLKILASLFFIDFHFTCRKRPQHQSRPHLFFADECHLFATDILTKILAEDRKFGLSLFLATQYLSQLSDRILEAILGNVGTLMLLQLGGPDADKLSRWLKPQVTNTDLMNLAELHAIVRTKGHEGRLELFTVKNEIVPNQNEAWIQEAWAYSDRQDGRSIEDVEKEMKRADQAGTSGSSDLPLFQ
ncbi:type IV secretory system conjugative DNA transfer family protein [Paenibacillus sp. S150]|uniref:type IV secretory system conjugative DNA transfer family protein n=1 Tax=Paenibacillus sp. S150 TaxID=2749826 RepID=UPI001C58EF69|nr:ATP-binding protein [Paenibacillus sp. S150]MBW4081282.1 ATP-binding protein [Paenibacillus sp. S150]